VGGGSDPDGENGGSHTKCDQNNNIVQISGARAHAKWRDPASETKINRTSLSFTSLMFKVTNIYGDVWASHRCWEP
jgi:hypothetical protein